MLLGCSYRDYLADRYGPVTFTDSHGVAVAANGYPVSPANFDAFVDQTFTRWQNVLSDCDVTALGPSFYVSWQPYPFDDARWPGPVVGLTQPDGPMWGIKVSFLDPASPGALPHELGHAILGGCGMDYGEENLARLTKGF